MSKPFPTHNDLICLSSIFSSHDDYSVVEDLYAGFDGDFNLVILCEHTDYDSPQYNCATAAILKKQEAYRLAKKLKVSLNELPAEISASMFSWDEIDCPVPGDVRKCFHEVTDCLLEEGCHFRILRNPAPNGFITC